MGQIYMTFENDTAIGRFLELNLAFWTSNKCGRVDEFLLDIVHWVDDQLIDSFKVKKQGKSLLFPHLYSC